MMRSMVLRGVVGVEGGEDEVAGLGGGYRRGDGLVIAHLADHDDIHVFAERALERRVEVGCVYMNLALMNERFLRGEKDIQPGLQW